MNVRMRKQRRQLIVKSGSHCQHSAFFYAAGGFKPAISFLGQGDIYTEYFTKRVR